MGRASPGLGRLIASRTGTSVILRIESYVFMKKTRNFEMVMLKVLKILENILRNLVLFNRFQKIYNINIIIN